MKKGILIILASVIFFAAQAQNLDAVVSEDSILIGEQIELRLSAEFEPEEPLTWFQLDTIPRFEILERNPVDTIKLDNGNLSLVQQFLITSWDSGRLQIPSFSLNESQTKPIPINVAYEPSPFDTTRPYHDVRGIIEVKKPNEERWYWYLIFALVLIALFLLFFPKAKKKDSSGFISDEGAFRRALRKLDQLQHKKDPDAKDFYTELTWIFREYLHKRRNIYSFSKTTDDLAIQMQKLNMNRDAYQELLQILRLTDLVKFARFHPSSEENKEAVHVIRNCIITIENLPDAV